MSAISLKSITGITSITTPAGVDNQLTLHNNNTTEAVKLDIAGNLHFHNHLNITGVSTASNFKTGTSNLHNTGLNVQDLDVDGHTNLDNVSIAGVTTMTGRLQIDSGDLKIFGTAPTLFLRDTNDNPDYRIMNSHGSLKIFDETNGVDRFIISPTGNVSILKDLDVDGHTNLDNVSIAGIVTAQNIRYQSGGNNWNGNPRSVVIGYSGSNYANLGMGWVPTSTNDQYTSANTDYQSRLQLYDGLQIYGSGASVTSGQTVTWNTVADFKPGAIKLYTSGSSNSEKLRITSNGKVNIGTGELDQTDRMLNIYGGRARISGITAGNSFEIYASNTSGQSYGILCQAGTNSSDINTALRNTSGVSLFRVRGDGVVFVGSSTVQQGSTSKLEVMGTLNNSYPNYSYPIMVSDDAAYNSSGGPGGGIGFSFKQNSGGAYAQAGGIRGVKENTTDGDYASALLFYTRANGAGTVEQVRINSKGQLNLGGGLGGTNTRNFTHLFNMHPLTNPAGALWNYNNNNVYLGQNIYFTGQYQRDQAAASSYFQQEGGKHKFYTAASGTAGAACTPYQIAAFEPNNIPSSLSSGNRPSYKGNLVLFGGSSATSQGGIEFHTSGGGGGGYGSRITAASDGTLAFHVRNNNSAWMTPLSFVWNGDLSWGENPNNTLYDEGSNHGAYYRRQQGSFQIATKSSSGWSNVYLNKNTSGGTNDYRWIDFYWNSTSRGQITWNGSNVVYGGQSDYRLKENVVDIDDGISRVKQLLPRRFNWISDETDTAQDGFIAHEVQSVIPTAVTGTKDQVVTQEEFDNDTQPEDKEVGTPIYQQMDYGKITPLLTAAVKELIAKVEALEADVAALKGS